jgi:hypothetical protein
MLIELGYEDSVIFENPDYDAAIVGIDNDGRVIYDFDRMIQCLIDEDGMTEEEAMEFIEYNTVRVIPYAGEKAPIILYKLE